VRELSTLSSSHLFSHLFIQLQLQSCRTRKRSSPWALMPPASTVSPSYFTPTSSWHDVGSCSCQQRKVATRRVLASFRWLAATCIPSHPSSPPSPPLHPPLTLGALRATKNAGLQPAMDHILAHNDEPVPTAEELAEELGAEANIPDVGEARSIKCSECGKTFRSQATASFHAEKSGHTDFEESTEEVSAAWPALVARVITGALGDPSWSPHPFRASQHLTPHHLTPSPPHPLPTSPPPHPTHPSHPRPPIPPHLLTPDQTPHGRGEGCQARRAEGEAGG
jgi:hypothetical protein